MKLIPPDKKQCQAEKPCGTNFMTLGGLPVGTLVRCTNKPTVIITEANKNKKDGKKGSMALCDDCLGVALKDFTKRHFVIKTIK